MEKMSTITFPDGSSYEITDAEARRLVSEQQQTIEQQQQTIEQQQQTINEQNTNFEAGTLSLTNSGTYAEVAYLRYSKAGKTTTVYVSIKPNTTINAGTVLTITGLPQALIEQSVRIESAFGRGQVEVIVNGTTATLTNLSNIASAQWLRFVFSYINP